MLVLEIGVIIFIRHEMRIKNDELRIKRILQMHFMTISAAKPDQIASYLQ